MAVQRKKAEQKKRPPANKKATPKPRKRAPAKARRKPASSETYLAAMTGNQFWKMRSSHGRKPIFATADELWDACTQYFEWAEANPLQEEKLFAYQGVIVKENVSKMRAMTLDGLQIFLDISHPTWLEYRAKEGFSTIAAQVDRIIRTQKFAGAAADLLNANIIARDLGLRDGMEHTGANGGPISGVLAIPTSPENWAVIAQAHQNALKQDAE